MQQGPAQLVRLRACLHSFGRLVAPRQGSSVARNWRVAPVCAPECALCRPAPLALTQTVCYLMLRAVECADRGYGAIETVLNTNARAPAHEYQIHEYNRIYGMLYASHISPAALSSGPRPRPVPTHPLTRLATAVLTSQPATMTIIVKTGWQSSTTRPAATQHMSPPAGTAHRPEDGWRRRMTEGGRWATRRRGDGGWTALAVAEEGKDIMARFELVSASRPRPC